MGNAQKQTKNSHGVVEVFSISRSTHNMDKSDSISRCIEYCNRHEWPLDTKRGSDIRRESCVPEEDSLSTQHPIIPTHVTPLQFSLPGHEVNESNFGAKEVQGIHFPPGDFKFTPIKMQITRREFLQPNLMPQVSRSKHIKPILGLLTQLLISKA